MALTSCWILWLWSALAILQIQAARPPTAEEGKVEVVLQHRSAQRLRENRSSTRKDEKQVEKKPSSLLSLSAAPPWHDPNPPQKEGEFAHLRDLASQEEAPLRDLALKEEEFAHREAPKESFSFAGHDNGYLELTPPTALKNPDRYLTDLHVLFAELDPDHGKVRHMMDQDAEKASFAMMAADQWLEAAEYQRKHGNIEFRQAVSDVMTRLRHEHPIIISAIEHAGDHREVSAPQVVPARQAAPRQAAPQQAAPQQAAQPPPDTGEVWISLYELAQKDELKDVEAVEKAKPSDKMQSEVADMSKNLYMAGQGGSNWEGVQAWLRAKDLDCVPQVLIDLKYKPGDYVTNGVVNRQKFLDEFSLDGKVVSPEAKEAYDDCKKKATEVLRN